MSDFHPSLHQPSIEYYRASVQYSPYDVCVLLNQKFLGAWNCILNFWVQITVISNDIAWLRKNTGWGEHTLINVPLINQRPVQLPVPCSWKLTAIYTSCLYHLTTIHVVSIILAEKHSDSSDLPTILSSIARIVLFS